jgi:hypothetical protein
VKITYFEAGPLLDYWVAIAAGYEPAYQEDGTEGPCVCINRCHGAVGELVPILPRACRPSSSWGDGAPIIEREHIDLVSDFGRWMARHGKRDDYSRADASPLVAAMRAYLMWEYGDELPTSAE